MHPTLKVKLLLGAAIIIAVMAISPALATYRMVHAASQRAALRDVRFPAATGAAQVAAAAARAASALRGCVLFGSDPADALHFKSQRATEWTKIHSVMADLQDRARKMSSTEQQLVAALQVDLAQYQALQDRIELLAVSHSSADVGTAYDLLKTDEAQRQEAITAKLADFREAQADSLRQTMSVISAEDGQTMWIMAVATLMAIFSGFGLALVASRRFGLVLDLVLARARSIAEGDLTGEDLSVNSQDEFGDLATAVNEMQRCLQGMIASVSQTAEQVASATTQMFNSSADAALLAQTQCDHAGEVANSMHQMSVTVQQVSEHSAEAARAASRTAETARDGGRTVDDSLTRIRRVGASVAGAAKKIGELGRRSDEIGRIVNVIEEIADQTNLLALNAAIEAARAGDQGRGFAVVADEVRKLAERTTAATKEIAQTISTVQLETKQAVGEMQCGTAEAEQGVEVTSHAGDALQQIIEMAENVGIMIAQIASASTEQSAATINVNLSVEQIARSCAESSEAAHQAETACRDLAVNAADMRQLVGRFRLTAAKPKMPKTPRPVAPKSTPPAHRAMGHAAGR